MDHTKPVLQTNWKLIMLAAMAVSMTGCASSVGTSSVMLNARELNQFETDCAYKDAQLEFLERQTPSTRELASNRIVNAVTFGTNTERRVMDQGWNNAIAIRKMNYLKSWCY